MTRERVYNWGRGFILICAILSTSVFWIILLRQYGALPTAKANHELLLTQSARMDTLMVNSGRTAVQVDSLIASLKPWQIPWTAQEPGVIHVQP
jgi:hypothetical protein